jgi:hypothetical protein
MEVLNENKNSGQWKTRPFLILSQENFYKSTIQYRWLDLLEIVEDLEAKEESVEIESLSYFEILQETKLIHLIPPPFQESQ